MTYLASLQAPRRAHTRARSHLAECLVHARPARIRSEVKNGSERPLDAFDRHKESTATYVIDCMRQHSHVPPHRGREAGARSLYCCEA
eukprot:34944-Eustigmatos_ZCMA.PRE.1